MISREPTLERLAVANSLLLAPYDLTEAHLKRALGDILSHGADDADLYFQYTRSEGWSLEEGIVKSGSFSIDQGVGVRAVSGEKTAFAYSDDLSWAALSDAAQTVRTIGAHGQSAKVKVPTVDGAVMLSVAPGSSSGRTLRLKGRGMTRKDGTRGDQLVTLEISLPEADADLAARLEGWKDSRDLRGKFGV